MSEIRVDIDELKEKLDEMLEDDYVTVCLKIEEDNYTSSLKLSAVSFDDDEEGAEYGEICEASEELF